MNITRSGSFSGLLHRVNTFVINFNCIYYSSNKFSKVQNLPSYLRNVQCDDIQSKFYGHLARRLRGLTFFMGENFPILQ